MVFYYVTFNYNRKLFVKKLKDSKKVSNDGDCANLFLGNLIKL